MAYRKDSGWNDKNELRCLVIYRKLEYEGFPRRRQTELCREMENMSHVKLCFNSISAKIGNYKSIAGVNNHSNASTNTKRIYEKFKNYSIEKLEKLIKEMETC